MKYTKNLMSMYKGYKPEISYHNIKIKSRKKKKEDYFENINTFDIEVTNYKKDDETRVGICYLWCYCIDEKQIIYGRQLDDFKIFLDYYADIIEKENAVQVIYIHNLAYEFQFLRYLFEWDDVFLVNIRRPLNLRYRCFEFRCSYLLTNMSLNNFFKNYEIDISKLNYDYNKKRYPWTELTSAELEYCYTDTLGLYKAINNLLKLDEKDVTTVPPTSTAYVRQDVKRVQTSGVRAQIRRISNIDPELYIALKSAFVGGNTHANRYYVDKVIDNVTCYDISSSYPFVQLTENFPVEPFREKKNLDNIKFDPKFAYLILCDFYDISIKDYFDGMAQISSSKCIYKENYTLDNGRILDAKRITIWLTDIEFNIIKNHYTYNKLDIRKCYYSRYGQLPDCIKSVIYTYFEGKCTLKNQDPYLYMKSKNKLNSIYGMSAFDIGKQRFTYEDEDYKRDTRSEGDILNDLLTHGSQAEPYAWGVWTTAHARKNLDDLICRVGDRFIYCDTDSVYIYGEIDKEIEDINKQIRKKSAEYLVTYEGKDYYIGEWQKDKSCRQFITLGAKKYAYTDDKGVHTVTSGVNRQAGVKDIYEYKIGHTFKNATNTAWYNDDPMSVEIEGHKILIPSSVYIEENDYTLGVTENYNVLLNFITEGNGDMIYYE